MRALLLMLTPWFAGVSADNSQEVPFRQIVIDRAFNGDGKALGDIDGDGLADIVIGGGELVWYRTPDWAKTIIADGEDFGTDVEVGDVSENTGGELAWYGATNPEKGPWTRHVIARDVDHVHSLQTADMDHDGDMDVFFAEMAQSQRKRVGFFRNGGNSLDWSLQVVDTTGSHNAKVGDIGGDGDIDIVGANWQGPPVLLWENLSSPPRPVGGTRAACLRVPARLYCRPNGLVFLQRLGRRGEAMSRVGKAWGWPGYRCQTEKETNL